MSLICNSLPVVCTSDAEADQAIRGAAEGILRAAIGLGSISLKPWSLAELHPTESDYRWLCDWASGLTRRTAQLWLTCEWLQVNCGASRLTGPAVIGAPLLLLASESARRRAGEHKMWPYIRRDEDNCLRFPAADDELFLQGQPTRAHKDALEAVARQLNLRHTFDEADTQDYYSTISFQFGFSGPGFKKRLPDWLVSRECRPLAVTRLLGPETASQTFKQLWDALWHFRRNNVSESHLRNTLSGCPWVLPNWIDELVERATGRATISESATEGQLTGESDEPDITFLEEPRLEWTDGPCFETRFAGIADLELSEDTYDLMLGTRRFDSIFRQSDGSYCMPSPDRLYRIQPDVPAVAANLVVRGGQTEASQLLALWNADTDVSVFRLSDGKLLEDDDRMLTTAAYAIRAGADLTLRPEPNAWYRAGENVFWRLDPGWDESTALYANGAIVWQSNQSVSANAPVPSWAQVRVNAASRIVELGKRFDGVIDHSEDAKVVFVRSVAGPIDFQPDGTRRTKLTSLLIPLYATRPILDLKIGLANHNSSTVIRSRMELPLQGAARLTSSGWEAMDSSTRWTVEQARREPVRVWPPEGAILDGDIWIRNISSRPKIIGDCLGLGERLTSRQQPYNIESTQQILAREVTDPGLLLDARRVVGESGWELELTSASEPDPDNEVLWWDTSGPWTTAKVQACELSNSWKFTTPKSLSTPAAIALSRAGAWLGVWCEGDWAESLKDGVRTFGARTMAQVVRWLRLPVLSRRSHRTVQKFAHGSPVEVLSAWLFDDPPSSLKWPTRTDGWLPVVASVFREWRPTIDEAQSLLSQFSTVTGSMPQKDELPHELQLCLQLARVDPFLMARIVQRIQEGTKEKKLASFVDYFMYAGVPEKPWSEFDQTLIEEAGRSFRTESQARARTDEIRWADQLAIRAARDQSFRIRLSHELLKVLI